jgi:deazaflavin-dependent oxidoreductase (nitroreductase family)
VNLLNTIGNPFMKLILRSPLHGLVSGSIMLITFTGRKSGKLYTTPVGYTREGDILTFFSYRARTWWRNLRGGAAVTVRLKGHDQGGTADAITDEERVSAGLAAYLEKLPGHAKYFQVRLGADGQPDRQDVARAGQERVLIRVELA